MSNKHKGSESQVVNGVPADAKSADVAMVTSYSKPKAKPVALSLGARMAERDPSELDSEYDEAVGKLRTLGNDSSISTELQAAVMALVNSASGARPGMEEVNTRWKISRIQIAQATSTTAAKPENAKNGDLFTTAGQLLIKPFEFVPIHFNYEHVMFPMGAKAPTCQAPDAKLGSPFGECVKCPNLPFGQQNGGKGDQKKTDCSNQIVAIIASADMSNVYQVTFAKTSRKAGTALMGLAGQMKTPWQQSFFLTTEKGNSEMGNYHLYQVGPSGRMLDEGRAKIAQALCDLYTSSRHRQLADWYRAASEAPALAAAAEVDFQGSKLDAGLAGEVEPFDLGDAAPATGSVRTSAKPM